MLENVYKKEMFLNYKSTLVICCKLEYYTVIPLNLLSVVGL